MSIKDLPHVTVEQVLVLRKAAIELEKELAELKSSLPKVRADAILGAAKKLDVYCINYVDGVDIGDLLEEYANQLEQGNE